MSKGRKRLLNVVLIISLAVNLLLLGGIVGRMTFGHPQHHKGSGHLGWMVRLLDAKTRQSLRPELTAHAREVLPLRRQMSSARHQFETVLLAPELDEKQLDAALAGLSAASATYQQAMHKEMAVIIKKMSLEERQRLAHFLHRLDARDRGRRDARGSRRAPAPPPAAGSTADHPPPP